MSQATSPRNGPTKARAAALGPPPSLRRWTVLCAVAEGIGMTAAAAAAKTGQSLVGEPSGGRDAAVVLGLVVAGGLVEGLALGVAQASGLASWLTHRRRVGWVLTTLAVAGVGWAAASAPSVLEEPGGTGPSFLLVVLGAMGIGLLMGAALGAAQALVLRGVVPHPWLWVSANVTAWVLAMPVIFVGATIPDTGWQVATVVVLGTATGLVAGAVLGVVSGWFLPSLVGPPVHNRVVLWVLASRLHRLLGRSLMGLRLRGVRSGAELTLPVMYAADDDGLVVVPGHPAQKRWWRNLRRPAPVSVLIDGSWQPGIGELLEPDAPGYEHAMATYQQRWPEVLRLEDIKVVRIRLERQDTTRYSMNVANRD